MGSLGLVFVGFQRSGKNRRKVGMRGGWRTVDMVVRKLYDK